MRAASFLTLAAAMSGGLLLPAAAGGQDSLGLLREDVRTRSRATAPPSAASEDRHEECEPHHHMHLGVDTDDHDGPMKELCEELFLWTITLPFFGPHCLVGDEFGVTGHFPRFPYELDAAGRPLPGYMMIGLPTQVAHYPWATRATWEYGDDFSGANRIGSRLQFDHASRWGIDAEANYRRDALMGRSDDDLWIGDANVVFRFAQSPHWMMRAGLGMNWLSDEGGQDYGVNVTYGGDWLPAQPWVFSADMDWGGLGHTSLFHLRTTAGVQVHGAELFLGYDYLDVGSAQIDGLVSGVRFWF